jgi:peptide chain release factor 1
MLDKLAGIEARYEELTRRMADPATAADYSKVAELAKERSNLEELVSAYREYKTVLSELDEARALLDSEEMRDLAQEEAQRLEARQRDLEARLMQLLLPKDPRDERNVIVEIRAGTGGDEAGLFAADLYRMYTRYAEKRNWRTELLSANASGIGGYKEVIFDVKGKGAYSRLKYESGVHRVQRVPATEAQGRIHTSTATVAVMAEVDEVEITVPDRDIKVDTFRSSGAGGQNVQKNSTAVRITHLPTGLVVACQDERSLVQNRLRAMSILRARLYEIEAAKRAAEEAASRRAQVGTGERSEKIRTYNFPQDRVTDHRIGVSVYDMKGVLDGNIDAFIDELALRDRAERLQAEGAPAAPAAA